MTDRLRITMLHVDRGGRRVLDVESLRVAAGELVVIAGGASGGKTTLAAALAGAVQAEGAVLLDGVPLLGPPARRRRAGLAAAVRDGERIVGCTVAEAIHLASARARRVDEALARFPQLATRRHVLAQLLSGGEQQLLQVACAWGARPQVLVLDSPTAGLAADAAAIVTALARQEAERGSAVLWLESDRRAAPAEPGHQLLRGRLEAVMGSGSALG